MIINKQEDSPLQSYTWEDEGKSHLRCSNMKLRHVSFMMDLCPMLSIDSSTTNHILDQASCTNCAMTFKRALMQTFGEHSTSYVSLLKVFCIVKHHSTKGKRNSFLDCCLQAECTCALRNIYSQTGFESWGMFCGLAERDWDMVGEEGSGVSRRISRHVIRIISWVVS